MSPSYKSLPVLKRLQLKGTQLFSQLEFTLLQDIDIYTKSRELESPKDTFGNDWVRYKTSVILIRRK